MSETKKDKLKLTDWLNIIGFALVGVMVIGLIIDFVTSFGKMARTLEKMADVQKAQLMIKVCEQGHFTGSKALDFECVK